VKQKEEEIKKLPYEWNEDEETDIKDEILRRTNVIK